VLTLETDLIQRLAQLRGIGDAYYDYRGELRHFSLETKADLLRAMGCAVDDPRALAEEIAHLEIGRSRGLLPAVAAAHGPRIGFDINVTAREFGASLTFTVTLEDGTRREGVVSTADCRELWRGEVGGSWITRRRFELPLDLPPGYHELQARVSGSAEQRCLLILSPPLCFEPPPVAAGGRLWGVAVQVYTLRSRGNWGIGDFADLRALVQWLAPRGAGFVGLNPLHALSPAEPDRSSPYSASNRHFLNVLYVAVPDVAEFATCRAAQERVATAAFQQRLAQVRAAALVDYGAVAALKFEILDLLYREFRERHLAQGTERAAAFREFLAAAGPMLELHARFDALDTYFRATRGTSAGWMSWPAEYHDPHGDAVDRFAAQHPEQIEFFAYLQWLAAQQLAGVQALAQELQMPIGLYGDFAVGANASGSETWIDRTSYRLGAEIGAPPDPLALKGQGWGIPPLDPGALEVTRFAGFVRLIRDNMRHYGALRLDHVMSLFRLWWVAAHHSPFDGAYVHYPLHTLLTILALESGRHSCVVIGEDLGVVPDEMRAAMPQYGLYHYKVMLFEQRDGKFVRPGGFVRSALATVTTHDMPTLRSYWEGRDIDLRRGLNLYPGAEVESAVRRERDRDRAALLAALRDEGLAPPHPEEPHEPFTPALAQALHLYLARSTSVLAAIQLEDLLGIVDPVNVPGTSHEYPNWQRKIDADLEDIVARADLVTYFAEIDAARRVTSVR
jgi:4-alpha-glucanotransferase